MRDSLRLVGVARVPAKHSNGMRLWRPAKLRLSRTERHRLRSRWTSTTGWVDDADRLDRHQPGPRHSLRDHATFAPLREPWPVPIAQSFSEIGTRCADSTERNAKRVKQMNDNENEDTESVECLADLTVRDWFDMLGSFFCQLGVMAAGFGIVVLAATLLTKWLLIPVLRAKGWCV